ncbi:MAG: hypothetical protein IPJ32_16985 [Sphingobacteriaceae bacterium]|nr:hypothetical protein [Sphingobacteriaceae bacterium]
MKTTFYSLLFIFFFSLANAQVAGRCKTEIDKDSKREYYTIADINGSAPFGFSIGEFMQANYRLPQKTYKKKDKISFAWLIEPTGALTFLKMNSLKDDKEIEDEVKRIISLMPNYAPAFCGKKKVPYIMEFTMAIDYLKKSQQ